MEKPNHDPKKFSACIASVIVQRAAQKGINLSELGRKTKLTNSPVETIQRIIHGKQRLNIEHLVSIANAFEDDPSHLVFLAEKEYRTQNEATQMALAAESPGPYNGDDQGNVVNG